MAQKDLRRVAKAAAKLNTAREELGAAILAAVESGETLRDIAPHAGLSYSRVGDLMREARERQQQSD